jgi:hypothetical protein
MIMGLDGYKQVNLTSNTATQQQALTLHGAAASV